MTIVIVGAGIAGLACARRLVQAGLQPILFDKGRGIGGRVATRRVDGLQFDHGAQYVTATGAEFAAVLRDLAASGHAAPWPDAAGNPRVVGTPGMSALGTALAVGLNVRQGMQVTAIKPWGGAWQVSLGETTHAATRVVVTVPAPQVGGLLGVDHPLTARLGGVRMAPCLTLMAGIAAPPPFVTRENPEHPIAWIAQDSAKPGRSATDAVAWVAQAGPAFSLEHLEDSPNDIVSRMLPLLCQQLGVPADRVSFAAGHRWRYAHVITALAAPFLRDESGTLYVGGDWCIGSKVEAAWTSGTAIATISWHRCDRCAGPTSGRRPLVSSRFKAWRLHRRRLARL